VKNVARYALRPNRTFQIQLALRVISSNKSTRFDPLRYTLYDFFLAVRYNEWIDGYFKQKLVDQALKKFSLMQSSGISPTVMKYNSSINCPFKLQKLEEASQILQDMQKEGIAPKVVTYNSLVDGYVE
jgi:pentatricopeptide repeat protein